MAAREATEPIQDGAEAAAKDRIKPGRRRSKEVKKVRETGKENRMTDPQAGIPPYRFRSQWYCLSPNAWSAKRCRQRWIRFFFECCQYIERNQCTSAAE